MRYTLFAINYSLSVIRYLAGGVLAESLLAEKSKKFALRIIKLYQYLQDDKEYVISKQILRSGTSIGANISEAVYAQSKADFVSKLSISIKEANETRYWLELLDESGILKTGQIKDLHGECIELIKILTSSINTAKKTAYKRSKNRG